MKRVVVTGMGVISPVGNDVKTFFDNLVGGVCGIAPITRFDTENYKVKVAAEVKDFDPTAHGIEKAEARHLDLYTQYALAAAKQAVDMSGIEGHVDPERLGVYVGSGIGGMTTLTSQHKVMLDRGPTRVSPFTIPMMISNLAAGNVAIRFNAKGPCLPVVTACATGTTAIGEAFYAIQRGDADAILAGGAEAAIDSLAIAGFTSCKALSTSEDPNAASLPFDKRRAGFVMGEGAGVLVLEEYEHAMARGAKIYAEMTGYGNTCDAHHVTAPDPEAAQAARCIKLALRGAAFDKLYVNAHGTGTKLNDAGETRAIKLAVGEETAYSKVIVSSSKSMTGHMLGAAGAVEAIVSVMALYTGIVPPTINYQEKDEDCDLDITPNTAREAKPDMAISTSLGFGGHNGCVAFRRV